MLDYFFKKVDVHLCPEVKGRITDEGKPVEGLKILRQLMYNDFDEIRDVVYTDSNGEFYFSEKIMRLPKRKISFQHNSTWQLVEAYSKSEEKKYVLWNVSHPGIKENNKFLLKLNSMNCDLNNQEVVFDFGKKSKDDNYFPYYGSTICRWENDFEIRNN